MRGTKYVVLTGVAVLLALLVNDYLVAWWVSHELQQALSPLL